MTKVKATPTARDLMEKNVKTVDPDAKLAEVVRCLLNNNVSNVPVVQECDGQPRLVGFISEADCMEHVANELFYGNPAPALNAQLIMKRHPVCVAPETNVFTLASIYANHRLRHLPVVENQILRGIVSRRDVLKALDTYYQDANKQRNEERNPPDVNQIINHRFIMSSKR